MNSGLALSIAGCCATGAVCFYLGTQAFRPSTLARVAPAHTSAAPQIAIVDMKSLFEAHPQFTTIEATLNTQRTEAKVELQRMEKHADSRSVKLFRETRSKEIDAQRERFRSDVVQDLQNWVTMAAEKRGIQLVLDSSGSSLNGIPVVVHARGFPDITDEVIAEMSK